MKTNTLIGLGILGVAGYVLWKMRKPIEPQFQDKELQKVIDDLKTMPELPPVFVPTGVTVSNPTPWVDRRPTYENAVFEDVESYLATNPNAHLIRRGWMREVYALDKDVKQLTKEEFEKAGVILVDGKVMIKDYYIDYIIKPDPKVIAEAMQKKIDEELSIPKPEPKWVVVKEPFYDNQDPLKRMQPAEVIAKYDPDGVEEKMRTYGRDCCTTGYRGAQVYYSGVGNSGYSETKIENGVKYGIPIVGATQSYIITAKDNLLDENGQPIVDEEGYQYWKYYKDVDKETAISRGWVNYKKVPGVVLYRNDYVMSASGDWIPTLRNF